MFYTLVDPTSTPRIYLVLSNETVFQSNPFRTISFFGLKVAYLFIILI